MARKYEQPFYSIQFLTAEPVQIGELEMNAEAVKEDFERYVTEYEEYEAKTRDLKAVKQILEAEFHKHKLNGKMALESFYAREIAAFNRKTRDDTPEGVEPKLLTLKIKEPDPALEIEYLMFPCGKHITVTDVTEHIQEAQFKGGMVKSLGLLNMKDVEAYIADPLVFIFTALDSAGLNMGEVEEIPVDLSEGNEIEPCSDCGKTDWDKDEEKSLWTCKGCGAVFEEPAEDNPPGDDDLLQGEPPSGEAEKEPAAGLSTAEVARAIAAKQKDADKAK